MVLPAISDKIVGKGILCYYHQANRHSVASVIPASVLFKTQIVSSRFKCLREKIKSIVIPFVNSWSLFDWS